MTNADKSNASRPATWASEYRVRPCTGIVAEQVAALRALRFGTTRGTTWLALR
jgi:hypothetical protein